MIDAFHDPIEILPKYLTNQSSQTLRYFSFSRGYPDIQVFGHTYQAFPFSIDIYIDFLIAVASSISPGNNQPRD